MITLVVITLKMLLAFIILSLIYLFIAHLLQSFKKENDKQMFEPKVQYERHIALVYDDLINESELITQVQWLVRQDYKNYSAYFFTKEELVEHNNLANILIVKPSQTLHKSTDFVKYARGFFKNKPFKVIKMDGKNIPGANFIAIQNEDKYSEKEEKQYNQIDAPLPKNNQYSTPNILTKASKEFDLLSHSLSLKSNKGSLESISKFQLTMGGLFLCSIILIGVDQSEASKNLLFKWISISGALFSIALLLHAFSESHRFHKIKKHLH
ncbi:MAG: hypothetical protein SGJ00_14050 [bacterium]|nr:hypothetical protein [bacterium]